MKAGAYIFGLFLIIGFLWFAFNEFELPRVLFGETKKTLAIIKSIDKRHAGRGVYYQVLHYEFEINDSIFEGQSNTGIIKSPKSIGDTLVIEFRVSNPVEHKVLGKKK